MNKLKAVSTAVLSAAIASLLGSAGIANATEPCGDFGECKVLTEINAADGDIGFHFLADGDHLIYGALYNPWHRKVFNWRPMREMRKQTSTELFQESAEELCDFDLIEDPDDIVVTLEQYTQRFKEGTYKVFGINADWEWQYGHTVMFFDLPAMPEELEWVVEPSDEPGEFEYEIAWEAGDTLGECADYDELVDLVGEGVLPVHPEDVEIAAWEIVLEPDVDDGDPLGAMVYSVRIPNSYDDDGEIAIETEIEVPDDYLETLPENTPAKIEVGAIGTEDNATFNEEDEICLNDTDPEDDDEDGLNGCGFEVEEEEEGDE